LVLRGGALSWRVKKALFRQLTAGKTAPTRMGIG
jgi:hypothetical protein